MLVSVADNAIQDFAMEFESAVGLGRRLSPVYYHRPSGEIEAAFRLVDQLSASTSIATHNMPVRIVSRL